MRKKNKYRSVYAKALELPQFKSKVVAPKKKKYASMNDISDAISEYVEKKDKNEN